MDKKPFDRFNDKPPRRNRFEDRQGRTDNRSDRFEGRSSRFGDRDERFGERAPRFEGRSGRFSDHAEGFRHSERFSGRSERFGRFENRGEGFEHKSRFNKPPRRDFGTQSGPRARAFERRRFTDHAAFVKSATVRLDADVAEYFKSAEAVNDALRTIIELSRLVTPKPAAEIAQPQTEAQEIPEESADGEPKVKSEPIEE